VSTLIPGITVRAALDALTQTLADAQIEEPRRLARRILCHALDWPEASLITRDGAILSSDGAEQASAIVHRAAQREPLSRIIAKREFFGLSFDLGADTLDPRPETEHLVDVTLKHFDGKTNDPLSILDVGTGTGAILLAVLSRLPQAKGLGIDIAPGALAIAEQNAKRLGLDAQARFLVCDLFPPLEEGRFDAILSNPPYIPSGDIPTLMPEVREYDPFRALDGGVDGLDFYRRIAEQAPHHLNPGGFLALEIGQGQAHSVMALLKDVGFCDIAVLQDYAGIERVVHAIWPEQQV
jgi:release factor glutamine methyltransferase